MNPDVVVNPTSFKELQTAEAEDTIDTLITNNTNHSKETLPRSDKTSRRKECSFCMAQYRLMSHLASLILRRVIGCRIVFLSIAAVTIVFSLQNYWRTPTELLMRSMNLDVRLNESLRISANYTIQAVNQTLPKGEKKPPGAIIFGVSKCGTRAILEYLKIHPDIAGAMTEIDFFNDDGLYAKGLKWYIEQMPLSLPGQLTVEKSPDYFQNPESAYRIQHFNRDIKLLLLLRDPVERLISQYMQLLDKNPKLPSFEQWAINPETGLVNEHVPSVRVSAYAEHLDHWFDAFPRQQIFIVEAWNLRENPFEEMKRVEHFLNLRPYFEPNDFYFNETRGFFCFRYRSTLKTKCLGKTKGREHIPVDERVKKVLKNYYKPFNNRLTEMLGFKFPWS